MFNRSTLRYFIIVFVLWVLYVLISLAMPSEYMVARYNITPFELNFVKITLFVPALIIWTLLMYGYVYCKKYAISLGSAGEARGFNLISLGLLIFFASAVFSSFWGLFTSYYTELPAPRSEEVLEMIRLGRVVSNYANIIFSLFAFYYLFGGSLELVKTIGQEASFKRSSLFVAAATMAFGAAQAYIVLNNPFRTFSDDPNILPVYYLDDALIATTIILPQIISWFFGLLAVMNFRIFQKHVPGLIYKGVSKYFAAGVGTIVGIYVLAQLLSATIAFWSYASLAAILGLVYVLYLFIGVGYLFIAFGANALSKIEQV